MGLYPPSLSRLMALVLGFAWASASLPGWGGPPDILRQEATHWLSAQAIQAYPEADAEVKVGALDPNLRLASCKSFRFFLPTGAKLWRNGSLGVQCTGPAGWQLYMTYQSRLTGPALVSLRPLPARHLLEAADVALAPVPYQHDPGSYLQTLPAGATLLRPSPSGQALRIQDLILPNVIQAGTLIRVRVSGNGFSVAQEGKALNAAKPGGEVRVRMPSGRIVQGRASPAGEVEVRP